MLHAFARLLGATLLVASLVACRDRSQRSAAPLASARGENALSAARNPGSPPSSVAAPSATASAASSAAAERVVRHGIAWFHDAPAAALALAKRERKPLVVDLWAGWCHTCLSMQEYVLTASKLPGANERFVFLAIDTELPSNAAFLQQHAVSVWPTFYVLAPEGAEIRGRWLGAATPAQFARFLADGERALDLVHGEKSEAAPLARLRRGDELAAEKRFKEAANEYTAALREAPANWARRPEAMIALASAYKQTHATVACAEAYLNAPSLVDTAPLSAADLAATALACGSELPRADSRIGKLRTRARAELERLCTNAHTELTPDDRGDACGLWIELCETLKDTTCVKRAAATRLSVLEDAARGMPDEVAAMYDFARSDTLLKLGREQDALALLEARERALPQNYNPPHQLARAYRHLKRWPDGLAAIDRALALAYGPRRLSLLGVKVDLLLGAGKKPDALGVLAEQLLGYRALPEGQKRPDPERKVAERLESLGGKLPLEGEGAEPVGAKGPN